MKCKDIPGCQKLKVMYTSPHAMAEYTGDALNQVPQGNFFALCQAREADAKRYDAAVEFASLYSHAQFMKAGEALQKFKDEDSRYNYWRSEYRRLTPTKVPA